MYKWFIYKWIKIHCPHICLFCKYRKQCENDKKPP